MPIPIEARRALAAPIFRRTNPTVVDPVLARLGVTAGPTFVEFFTAYEGSFGSKKIGFELLDLCEGNCSVASQTELCRAQHGFPRGFLVLTELFGGGALVYSTTDEAVYNVDFEGGDESLIAGTLLPQWPSFAEFLSEYFAE